MKENSRGYKILEMAASSKVAKEKKRKYLTNRVLSHDSPNDQYLCRNPRKHGKWVRSTSILRAKLSLRTVPEGDLCSEKCQRHCTLKVPVSVRQQIFGSFYSLDTNSQNSYLFSNIEPCRPQMQRVSAKSHQSMSFRYRLIADGEVTYIYKKAFARLHGITLSKIRHLTDQMKSGTTAPHACERGTHRNRPNRVLPEAAEQVIKHIKLFPAESSHYSREKNASRQYLSSTLSIEKM